MTVLPFAESRLPEDIERGAQGGAKFKTTVLTLSSGKEQRNQEWEQARGEWNISYGIEYLSDLVIVRKHFMSRRGRLVGFRFKDWSDFTIPDFDEGGMDQSTAAPQSIGIGDGSNKFFQIFKLYTDGVGSYQRVIFKTVTDTLKVYVNDILTMAYTEANGLIEFDVAPANTATVKVKCEFDTPVRFDTDIMQIKLETFEAGSIPAINIVELKLDQTVPEP